MCLYLWRAYASINETIKVDNLCRKLEGYGHVATIELSPWQNVAVTIQIHNLHELENTSHCD